MTLIGIYLLAFRQRLGTVLSPRHRCWRVIEFSGTALFPADDFFITRGSPVTGGMHGSTRHYFCPHCLSWLFTRPGESDAFIGVRSSLLDQPQRYAPFMETWVREKLPWASTGARVSYDAFPDPQDYPALMVEFMAAGRVAGN
ncbi:GFA family protein [Pseudomonas putida]|uniref:GFA family protein n=1 Tax=Pseudomonas putida TaxID=303 RepID=UPI002DBEC7CD|nr:GFA family protein [Pseudomonas putida]WRW01739.1 GFA family protein [Pseudomonas putida]